MTMTSRATSTTAVNQWDTGNATSTTIPAAALRPRMIVPAHPAAAFTGPRPRSSAFHQTGAAFARVKAFVRVKNLARGQPRAYAPAGAQITKLALPSARLGPAAG